MNDNRVVWLQKHSVIGKNLSDHVANYGQQEILVEQSFVNDYEVKHLVGFSRRHIATRPWHCGVETADV